MTMRATSHRHCPDSDGIATGQHARPPQEVGQWSEDRIDASLKESFPASDPPSWAGPARIGSPRRDEEATVMTRDRGPL
jgi:hypothetical protein